MYLRIVVFSTDVVCQLTLLHFAWSPTKDRDVVRVVDENSRLQAELLGAQQALVQSTADATIMQASLAKAEEATKETKRRAAEENVALLSMMEQTHGLQIKVGEGYLVRHPRIASLFLS